MIRPVRTQPPPPVDPLVATWARIIRGIVERRAAEREERRRRITIVEGGKEGKAT